MYLGGAKIKAYAGIDLHSRNNYLDIIDEHDQRLYQKRLPNCLDNILAALEPFKEEYLEGVVVESSYHWYWLVDGLQEHGYKVHFDETAITAIRQGSGGLFRKASHLARGAIIVAAKNKSMTINADHVRMAATEIF